MTPEIDRKPDETPRDVRDSDPVGSFVTLVKFLRGLFGSRDAPDGAWPTDVPIQVRLNVRRFYQAQSSMAGLGPFNPDVSAEAAFWRLVRARAIALANPPDSDVDRIIDSIKESVLEVPETVRKVIAAGKSQLWQILLVVAAIAAGLVVIAIAMALT